MRHLVLLASLAIAIAACRDAAGPGDAALSEASVRARIDLREDAGVPHRRRQRRLRRYRRGRRRGRPRRRARGRRPAALAPSRHVEGRDAATTFLASAPIAPSALSWEVIAADVSNDASQGYTWAQGSSTIDLGTGATPCPSFFLTYWRRTGSGDWEIAAFVAEPGRPGAAAAARRLRHARDEARPQLSHPTATGAAPGSCWRPTPAFSAASV